MKKLIIVLLFVSMATPLGVNAQSAPVSVNRDTILQLIVLLQKQIVILSEQLARKTVEIDRCPNILGTQSKMPDGFIYSRVYKKCLTEKELDRLDREVSKEESEAEICIEKREELQSVRKSFVKQENHIQYLKEHAHDSRGNRVSVESVESILAEVRHIGLRSDMKNVGVLADEIISEENELDKIQADIIISESEVDEACD